MKSCIALGFLDAGDLWGWDGLCYTLSRVNCHIVLVPSSRPQVLHIILDVNTRVRTLSHTHGIPLTSTLW